MVYDTSLVVIIVGVIVLWYPCLMMGVGVFDDDDDAGRR